jgi:hypothetical protein
MLLDDIRDDHGRLFHATDRRRELMAEVEALWDADVRSMSDAEVFASLMTARFDRQDVPVVLPEAYLLASNNLATTGQFLESIIIAFENNIKSKKLTFCGVWFGINIIESDLIQNP